MSTYQDYQKQIEELQRLANSARESEIASAKSQIREIMQEHGLTLSDLGAKSKEQKVRKSVEAKYRDATGNEWTGRGRAPNWLAGKNKEDFLIK